MGTVIRQHPVQLSVRLISTVAVLAQPMVSPAPDAAVLAGVRTGAPGASGRLGLGSCGYDFKLVPADFPTTLSRARGEPRIPWHGRP